MDSKHVSALTQEAGQALGMRLYVHQSHGQVNISLAHMGTQIV